MNNLPSTLFPSIPVQDFDLLAKWINADVDFRIANLTSGILSAPPIGSFVMQFPTETVIQEDLFEKQD